MLQKPEDISQERFLADVESLKLRFPVARIAKETGFSKSNVSRYLKGDLQPSANFLKVFYEWFQKSNQNVSRETNEPKSFLEQRRQQKNKSEPFMVPLVPVKAQAGYVTAMDQEVYVDTLEKYALPPGVNPQGAVWRYWEIEGRSMEPEYKDGDVLLTSQVPYMDWENLRNFYAYVIVTPERVMFKRVFCKNELEWVLISENEDEFPQQLLPVEFIKEVWVVRRVIKNKLPPVKMFEIKV